MAKIDWKTARKDYVSDESYSFVKIAEKYGVSETSVSKHARKNNWMKLREATLQKITEKLPEKISESVAEYQARKFMHGKKIVERAMGVIEDQKMKFGGKVANEMIGTGYKIQDQALGLDDPKNVINIQNNNFISLDEFWKKLDKDIENERVSD